MEDVRSRAKKVRPRGGDDNHKQRMKLMHFLPPFLIRVLYEVSIFLTSFLGVDVPSVGLEKDGLGSIIISSVGNFGFKNAYTSLFGTVGQWCLLTVNAPH